MTSAYDAGCHVCRSKLQQSNASRKQNVTDKPFKMASPMKASVGVGDYYGTIGGKIPYVAVSISNASGHDWQELCI